MPGYPLVAIRSFIQATRDSGYKSTSAAIAELVDNSFEAQSDLVDIALSEENDGKRIVVTDNGTGMPAQTMQLALQFGGSTRFNSRRSTGRYGMGLPNGSLSQARRVDVYSWTNPHKIWSCYLDVDEIVSGALDSVPPPVRFKPASPAQYPSSPSGTIVSLAKCDRLDYRTLRAQTKRLHFDLGRTFRQQLYEGKALQINGELVRPIDPLFFREGNNLIGAEAYGPPLTYDVACDGGASRISVRFSLLPIDAWHSLSNEEKNRHGISKGAGVSVVRAGREIDYGWYFMGTKRKENYDDWWRCEICFNPDLDELFGVTHTKQRVNPTEALNEILTPDLERIARDLNNQVRKLYTGIRGEQARQTGAKVAESRDGLMEPIRTSARGPTNGGKPRTLGATAYQIDSRSLDEVSFYLPSFSRDKLSLVLNREHNFFHKIYEPLSQAEAVQAHNVLEHFQLLLLAAARAECAIKTADEKNVVRRLRESWSNALTAFLD